MCEKHTQSTSRVEAVSAELPPTFPEGTHTVNQQHFVAVLPPTVQESANSHVIPWNVSNRGKTNGSTRNSTVKSLRRTRTGKTTKQPQPQNLRFISFLLYLQPNYVAVGPVICCISYSTSLIQVY
jgi:hypothetical protein